mmetsp:Transcript_310/g.692  ORF Transcript_310/g.692 Transcript_310/m.692 type:complete len:386 (+) Transcript_310:49-1206(+)
MASSRALSMLRAGFDYGGAPDHEVRALASSVFAGALEEAGALLQPHASNSAVASALVKPLASEVRGARDLPDLMARVIAARLTDRQKAGRPDCSGGSCGSCQGGSFGGAASPATPARAGGGCCKAGDNNEGCCGGSAACQAACQGEDGWEAALRKTAREVYASPGGLRALVADLSKVAISDPACGSLLQPLLLFKGFHALAVHRVAHALWQTGTANAAGAAPGRTAALLLQAKISEKWGADIHPGAKFGEGCMLDHATGVVIGATAEIGRDCYLLHGVTLGSSGKPVADPETKRHPSIGAGCILGAGCTVLGGHVKVGDKVSVGAGAVVTKSVPDGATVVGANRVVRAGKAPEKRAKGKVGAGAAPPKPTPQAAAPCHVRPRSRL